MINICLFCGHVFMKPDFKSQKTVEGVTITDVKCGNCGAEFQFSMTIEHGPVRDYVVNDTSENMANRKRIQVPRGG